MNGTSTVEREDARKPVAGARRAEAQRFGTFLLTGGVAALCNVGSRALFSRAFGYGTAVTLAYGVGVLVAFVLAKLFVFSSNERRWHAELARFALVNCAGFAQVWLVSMGLERYLFPRVGWSFRPELCAHVIGVASPVVISYLGHKHFTFGAKDLEVA